MKEFYNTWSELDWDALRRDGTVQLQSSIDIQIGENQSNEFVAALSPQYLLLAIKEHYSTREL